MTIDHEFLEPEVMVFVDAISRQFGERVDAIFLYGSWRRGWRDTMPDFYVLLNCYPTRRWHWPTRLLPPTVLSQNAGSLRAKVAVVTTTQLVNALNSDFHSYFWARFAQPIPLLFARNEMVHTLVDDLRGLAQKRLINSAGQYWSPETLPPSPAFWHHTFGLTYGAELRPERITKFDELYRADIAHYDALYSTVLPTLARADYNVQWNRLVWRCRQGLGKVLSAVRLLKSVTTFDDPLGYVAWKVRRQSGVALELSERARRWPLLFGWGYVWRLYRLGAFR